VRGGGGGGGGGGAGGGGGGGGLQPVPIKGIPTAKKQSVKKANHATGRRAAVFVGFLICMIFTPLEHAPSMTA